MKQHKGGYNVNRYDWKNKTTEHLLNDNSLADSHVPEWIRENEIATLWLWLIVSHTVPEKLKPSNESELNSALEGVIVMEDDPMTIIPSSHEIRLDVIGKWTNALILYRETDRIILITHQDWLGLEKRNEAKWLKKNTEQLRWAWECTDTHISPTCLSWFNPVSDDERYIAIVVLLKALFPTDTPCSLTPKEFRLGFAAKERSFDKMHNASRKQFINGKKDKRVQINVKISPSTKSALDRLTRERRATRQAILEQLILHGRLDQPSPLSLLAIFFFL